MRVVYQHQSHGHTISACGELWALREPKGEAKGEARSRETALPLPPPFSEPAACSASYCASASFADSDA